MDIVLSSMSHAASVPTNPNWFEMGPKNTGTRCKIQVQASPYVWTFGSISICLLPVIISFLLIIPILTFITGLLNVLLTEPSSLRIIEHPPVSKQNVPHKLSQYLSHQLHFFLIHLQKDLLDAMEKPWLQGTIIPFTHGQMQFIT